MIETVNISQFEAAFNTDLGDQQNPLQTEDYTIFVSEDGGPFTAFLSNTPDTSGTFFGENGKTYAFYSVARDQTGNLEDVPSNADTSTTVQVPEPTEADLALTKSDAVDPVTAGNDVTYTVVVSNAGPDAAQNVVLTDTLPAGVTFASAAPDQGTCNELGGVVTYDLGAIPNGGSVNLIIVVTTTTEGALTNTASVASETTDPNAANNSASETTTVNPVSELMADLAVSKRDDPDPVAAGNSLTYTITVTNNGPDEAENVVVTDTLPSEVSNATTSGCSEDPGGVPTCSLGNIASGDSVEYTITVDVDADTSGTILNAARISSGTTDPHNANDSATEETMVEGICPDDVLISNYQILPRNDQFVEVANVGTDPIRLDACSLVTFNGITELSIGDATQALSGILNPGGITRVPFTRALPTSRGAIGLYNAPPPPDGTPFSTDNETTGMVYLNNNRVLGISHLTVPAHNAIYECIYGGTTTGGPFTRPFKTLDECLGE
ncbi:MAG: DUF11 domain-containing protein [Candidatus Tectomicrobia bacterium]|nr:DUF11 domain-containing protein [Candidatus Tectomicrobia bacterium]